MEAMPEVPRQQGRTPFWTSPPAKTIQQLALIHSPAPLPAITTRPLVVLRSFSTPRATAIQLRGRTLFLVTPQAVLTRPPETSRSSLILPALPTRRPAILRSLTIRSGSRTRASVLARSVATPPATTTRPLVRLLSLTTLPVTAILRWEGLPAATSRRPIMLFA